MTIMEYRFVPYSELKDFFKKNRLKDDLERGEAVGICSVADVLFITEDKKKGNLNQETSLIDSYSAFEGGPEESGKIIVVELDREQLNEALFGSDYDETELWRQAARSDIEPRLSISLLVLKRTAANDWWSADEVFKQMCDYYELQEE
ncbi:MAG: hypothetical protein GY757_23105 [bacterium]|nr:hypothetical protein [bacterium]